MPLCGVCMDYTATSACVRGRWSVVVHQLSACFEVHNVHVFISVYCNFQIIGVFFFHNDVFNSKSEEIFLVASVVGGGGGGNY